MRSLPVRVRFFPGESTGSYVTRLAEGNRIPVGALLASVGRGKSRAVDPRLTELYVDRAGRARLADLAGCPVERLTRALVSTRDAQLLPDGHEEPVWRWPWQPLNGFLVRGCSLCAARRRIEAPVWLMWPDPWRVCVEHARLTDNSRDDSEPFIDLAGRRKAVDAERQLALIRRWGPVGRAVVADAFGILAHPLMWDAMPASRRRAPLGRLPMTAKVAQALVRVERRRLAGRLTKDDYAAWRQQMYADWGPRSRPAVQEWSQRHRLLPGHQAQPGTGLRLPPRVPHSRVAELASLEEATCLPWILSAHTPRQFG